jgi:hypothetical protein
MQKLSINLGLALSLFSILLLGLTTTNAQLSEEVRPFDFSNDYYKTNGLIAETLTDRKTGVDGKSVFDSSADPRFSNIRITETLPAYSADGSPIFWNYYGTATKDSFMPDATGAAAVIVAKNYPLFIFPSSMLRGIDRQAALIPVDSDYFVTNPIGIARRILVEFNDRISRSGQKTLNLLTQQNGTSIDGTPIIRTSEELGNLIADGLVTLREDENAPYAVAKVMQYPQLGSITPDAFLVYVRQVDGQPLTAERHFVTQFQCLQNGSRTCFGTMTTTR